MPIFDSLPTASLNRERYMDPHLKTSDSRDAAFESTGAGFYLPAGSNVNSKWCEFQHFLDACHTSRDRIV